MKNPANNSYTHPQKTEKEKKLSEKDKNKLEKEDLTESKSQITEFFTFQF